MSVRAASQDRNGRAARAFPRLSLSESLGFFVQVVLPTWAKGILLRRPSVVALAENWDLDDRAVHFMQRLRRKRGPAPLLLRKPGRPQLLLLDSRDMGRVLNEAPHPFTPASKEKRAALSHFEPRVSLISRGPERAARRAFNDEILQSNCPVHSLAQRFAAVVRDEAAQLQSDAQIKGELTWPMFTESWYRAVRRIVLGDAARRDRELTETLARLRANANWVFFRPVANKTREAYFHRLGVHLARAEAGSLAEMILRHSSHGDERPADQATQWLFAFDGGGITTFRALALFASHPQQREEALSELDSWRDGDPTLPYLRAGFLDAVRLWPTTPVLLRDTDAATRWDGLILPKGSGVIIYVPFFHRDGELMVQANRFWPEFWLGRDPADAYPFVPFSAGPAACPGRHLVSLVGSMWLAALLDGNRWTLLHPKPIGPGRPLPGTLDHFRIRFRFLGARAH